MRIVIQPTDGKGSLVADSELRYAMQVLRTASILVAGGGIVGHAGEWVGVILLRSEADSARALETLAGVNIKASA